MADSIDEQAQAIVEQFFKDFNDTSGFYARILTTPAELLVHASEVSILLDAVEREVRVRLTNKDRTPRNSLERFKRNLIDDLTEMSRTVGFPWGVRFTVQVCQSTRTPADRFVRLEVRHEVRRDGLLAGACQSRHKGGFRIGSLDPKGQKERPP